MSKRIVWLFVIVACLLARSASFAAQATSHSAIVNVTSDYPCGSENQLLTVDASGGAILITLPPATSTGQTIAVVLTNGSNNVTVTFSGTPAADPNLIDPHGAKYMGGAGCAAGESCNFISDGNGKWYVTTSTNNGCVNNTTNVTNTYNVPVGGAINTFLVTYNNTGGMQWQTLNKDGSLTGDGVSNALGVNTAHGNNWSVQQTFTGGNTIKYVDGNQIAGAVLTSDNTGQAQWATLSGGGTLTGTGAANRITVWNTGTDLGFDNSLTWDATNHRLGIGTTSPQYAVDINGVLGVRRGTAIDIDGGAYTAGTKTITLPSSNSFFQCTNYAADKDVAGLHMPGGNQDGMILYLYNLSVNHKLKFKYLNSSAAAADQIYTLQGGFPSSGDLIMDGPSSVGFIYDGNAGKWIMFEKNQ